MPRLNEEFKQIISSLEKKELEKLVLKAASTNKAFHDYVLVNFVDNELGEQDLFDQVKQDLVQLSYKRHKGYAPELKFANYLQACNKRITEFSKVNKTKTLELELIMTLLNDAFFKSNCSFGTCFTKFNHQVTLLLKKAITIVEKKIHEDLRMEYVPQINVYLKSLHSSSDYLDYVSDLPLKLN
jgi:hypothetical protein